MEDGSIKIESLNVIVERGEDSWFISEIVELPGCHTQGKTKKQLLERTKEAIQAYLEKEHIPKLIITEK